MKISSNLNLCNKVNTFVYIYHASFYINDANHLSH
jgi:hypothetical protein